MYLLLELLGRKAWTDMTHLPVSPSVMGRWLETFTLEVDFGVQTHINGSRSTSMSFQNKGMLKNST